MFQSTHSLRSATNLVPQMGAIFPVSIHALLAECDSFRLHNHRSYVRFNPRTPCGVRPFRYGLP